MSPLEQLRAELRATKALAEAETDPHKHAVLEGECAYLLEAIAFQQRVEALEVSAP